MLKPTKDFPAFLHKRKNHVILVIADLHLGWELNLSRKGIHVPSQMQKMLTKLMLAIDATQPDSLLILGDVKHTVTGAQTTEWRDVPEFLEKLTNKVRNVHVIRGNHDGNLEPLLTPNVQLHPSTGLALNDTGFFHGHTWPARKLLKCRNLVIAHVHPTVTFRDNLGFRMTTRVWVRARCHAQQLKEAFVNSRGRHKKKPKPIQNLKDTEVRTQKLFIMPCFNEFLGGRSINKTTDRKSYIGPVLRSGVVDIDDSEVYLLDGTFLGTVRHLKNFA